MTEASPRLASFIYFPPSPQDKTPTKSKIVRTPPRCGIPGKSNKRRQEQTPNDNIVENRLVMFCRASDWRSVVQRCRSNPEEASLNPVHDSQVGNRFYLHSSKRCVKQNFFDESDLDTLFHETPLGLTCACNDIQSDVLYEVIVALIVACPGQVRASQLLPGHTPLRDALLNPCCDVRILRALLDADEVCNDIGSLAASALIRKDRNGHLPVDHILMRLQLGGSRSSLDLFKEYFNHKAQKRHSDEIVCSPLIKLLTIGSSFNVRKENANGWNVAQNDCIDDTRHRLVLEATKFLLGSEPSIMLQCSKLTGCSPLHVGLRNFGNYLPLINVLTSRPESKQLMAQRNRFGDLPLHVASSVGVPYSVLRKIVESTIAAAKPQNSSSAFSLHPLTWSENDSGYTAIDLEWVRHIEGGQGFFSTRSFYPLEPSGVRKHCFKQDEYYRDLLCEAVDKVIQQRKPSTSPRPEKWRRVKALNVFGSLLDRISLLVAATSSSISTSSSATLLHNVCKLSALPGPRLPEPLIELYLWTVSDQLMMKDSFGMLPIHYALSFQTSGGSRGKFPLLSYVLRLLEVAPSSSHEPTMDGRLPLHLLLDYAAYSENEHSLSDFMQVLESLVRCFPESVDHVDPTSKLDPFLLAARNPTLPLEVVYYLLRHSPSRCDHRIDVPEA